MLFIYFYALLYIYTGNCGVAPLLCSVQKRDVPIGAEVMFISQSPLSLTTLMLYHTFYIYTTPTKIYITMVVFCIYIYVIDVYKSWAYAFLCYELTTRIIRFISECARQNVGRKWSIFWHLLLNFQYC